MQTDTDPTEQNIVKLTGWTALTLFVAWLCAIAAAIFQSSVFPAFADQFIPARIHAHSLLASLNWFVQLVIGTAGVALAVAMSDYLAAPKTILTRFARIAGIIGGAFFIAAGAGGQENVFLSVFYSAEQTGQLVDVIGTPDLTVITVANSLVAGGFRSTGAYATGWAMVLWSVVALRTRRFPAVLNWIGIAGGTLFALTVWIGPITGLPSFIAMQIWHIWLAILLLRAK
jgi:hypothetical protein